jgi:transposase
LRRRSAQSEWFQRQPSLGVKISILAKRIAGLQSTIRDLDRQITALYNSLPCKPRGFPVGRAPSLATIISEIGDIHRYPTLKKFLSHLGWCPQSFQTGNYRLKHPKMSHAGNKYVRRLIWMLSIFAVQFVPRYREYFLALSVILADIKILEIITGPSIFIQY